jgi:hypothetical protein
VYIFVVFCRRCFFLEDLRRERRPPNKILLSLVERLQCSEAKLTAQAEAHEAKVQELKKKVAKATDNFNVEVVKHEICEIERSRLQKNVDELRASKERCYEISMECARNLKNSFSKVGAYSSKQKFICGNRDKVIQWINGEVKAFEEVLSWGLLCLRWCPCGYIHPGES